MFNSGSSHPFFNVKAPDFDPYALHNLLSSSTLSAVLQASSIFFVKSSHVSSVDLKSVKPTAIFTLSFSVVIVTGRLPMLYSNSVPPMIGTSPGTVKPTPSPNLNSSLASLSYQMNPDDFDFIKMFVLTASDFTLFSHTTCK